MFPPRRRSGCQGLVRLAAALPPLTPVRPRLRSGHPGMKPDSIQCTEDDRIIEETWIESVRTENGIIYYKFASEDRIHRLLKVHIDWQQAFIDASYYPI
jgi:hypothetical protein